MKIIYIGGYSRSGSTLLLRMLGEQAEMVAVGELFDLWSRSYSQNQLCGCGSNFLSCDFWTQVTKEAFGCSPANVPAEEFNRLRSRVQGYHRILALWKSALRSPKYRRELRSYAAVLGRVYEAVRTVSGSQIIVDSSKVPQYAWVLAEVAQIELHMIHLVRDSRAAAFSWGRRRVRPEITTGRAYMARHSAARSAAEWNIFNFLLRRRRASYASYHLVKYEDLVMDPYREVQKILGSLGISEPPFPAGPASSVALGASHTASGNPSRFRTGDISISPDSEWTHAMRSPDRLLVTALTIPGLIRYGYPLRTGRNRR